MRSIIAGLSLGVVLLAVGCNVLQPRSPVGPGPREATPKVEDLIGYLNTNARRIQNVEAVSCTNVDIDVQADGRAVSLAGKLMCQTPRNFRLTGVVLGNPAVDVGSNKDEFWYWISRDKPPYLYHCSYAALARGVNIPFPFQPDMAVSALGLAEYDPNKKYEMKIVDNKKGYKAIELIEQAVSPQNQPIQKVTVFDFHEAPPPQPQVIAHVLKDAQGNVLCVAEVRKVQQVGSRGAVLPKEVVFRWPSQKLQMTMKLHNPQIVIMNEEKAARVFSRRDLGYTSFDLATRTLDSGTLQRAGATTPVGMR
ncbi:MAG TPA: hypothetical protein VH682_03935 [Gemmataceae bacterium]|jgi:hypothetical protein